MPIEIRNKIETIEIEFPTETFKFISTNVPIEIINEYYGHRPYLKHVDDIASEIKEKDTVTRRLKVTLIDELDYIDITTSTNMASYWRLFIARNKNYKGKIIRYYRRLGDGPLELKFAGRIDNIKIAANGNINIEAVDLLKAMSKVDYPFMTGLVLTNNIPAVFIATSDTDMTNLSDAIEGDYCKRIDFISPYFNDLYYTDEIPGSLSPGSRYYTRLIGFSSADYPIVKAELVAIMDTANYGRRFRFKNYADVSYYKLYIYGWSNEGGGFIPVIPPYIMTTIAPGDPPSSFDFTTTAQMSSVETDPAEAVRYFKLITNGNYSILTNWEAVSVPIFTMDIDGDAAQFDNSGYLKLDDEIIYYDSIATDSEGASLMGVIRGLFGTESPLHYADTMFYLILSIDTPIDIFLQMKKLLLLVGLDDTYLSTKFDEYAALGTLNVTTLPIIKETKLSDIYFDLVNLADCISFQNEEGLIDILKLDEMPASYVEITDEANIIYNTSNLDLNEKTRLTRWILLWNRIDIDKSLTDDEAYYRGNITVDGDAEAYYGDVLQDKQYTAFLNAGDDPAEVTAINTYVNELLDKRRIRTNEAQWQITAELEIKDDAIKIGQVVKIRTQKVLDENGIAQLLKYRVMKKEPGFNKIKFTFQRMIEISPPDIEAFYYMDLIADGGTLGNYYWHDSYALGLEDNTIKAFNGGPGFLLPINGHQAHRLYVYDAIGGTDFPFVMQTAAPALRTTTNFTLIFSFLRHLNPPLVNETRKRFFDLETGEGNIFRIENCTNFVVKMLSTTGTPAEIVATSDGTYADDGSYYGKPYVAVVIFNQTNKTITFHIEAETKTASDNNYTPVSLSSTLDGHPQIGSSDGTGSFAGVVGDFLIFNEVLNKVYINFYGNMLSERIGRSWIDLI